MADSFPKPNTHKKKYLHPHEHYSCMTTETSYGFIFKLTLGGVSQTFYNTVVAPGIFYGVVCWGSSISAADRKRLNELIKRASSVLGCPLWR